MSYKGKLSFKDYNPDKYGIKIHKLSESETGFVYNFGIYHRAGKWTYYEIIPQFSKKPKRKRL